MVMMRQAELWELRPQGSNPCRNMRRYKRPAMERFLSAEELKRLGFVLDHADDAQAAAAIRLLLFTGARSSEIIGLRWEWIRETRAVLPGETLRQQDRTEDDPASAPGARRAPLPAALGAVRLPQWERRRADVQFQLPLAAAARPRRARRRAYPRSPPQLGINIC